MIINLVGLLDDGAPLSPGVEGNPRRAVQLTRGSNVTLKVTAFTPQGVAVDFTGGSLVFTVKKNPDDSTAVISKTATIAATLATFALLPADFRNMEPGNFAYDIWLTRGGSRDAIIPLSPLWLEPAAAPIP